MQQNAGSYVPRKALRKEVAADLRMIFDAPERAQAEHYLKQIVEKYADLASGLAEWIEENIPEGLAVFEFPKDHRARLCTTNGLERLSQKIKRRTRVVRIFPNETSCLRLVTAILMEISEEWKAGKVYLSFDTS